LRGFAGTRDSDLMPGLCRNRACNPAASAHGLSADAMAREAHGLANRRV
jgi:hypothetical protein